MDVTILIAPAGVGEHPVRFCPKTHILSVPNDDTAEDLVERYTAKLASQYENPVYVWESVHASMDLMEKFRRYVLEEERKRLLFVKRTEVVIVNG